MYYSEKLRSPISEYNVKRYYGVNPSAEPGRAKAAGVYPLREAPEGMTVVRYEKYDDHYRAISGAISNQDVIDIKKIHPVTEIVKTMIKIWVEDIEYEEGDYVRYEDKIFVAVRYNQGISPMMDPTDDYWEDPDYKAPETPAKEFIAWELVDI